MGCFLKVNHSIMSEGQYGGLLADLDVSFFKSKRGLLKVSQLVSVDSIMSLPFLFKLWDKEAVI